MGTRHIEHEVELKIKLRDPEYASHYLMAALEENDTAFFLQELKKVVDAHGISHISKATEITRAGLYRMLSEDGNPSFSNLREILNKMNLDISITPLGRTGN